MLGTNATYTVEKCGFFTPKIQYSEKLFKDRLDL